MYSSETEYIILTHDYMSNTVLNDIIDAGKPDKYIITLFYNRELNVK
jgi:hypothetical protein